MGTRADFYVKKDKEMEWIASKSFDGYPDGISKDVLNSTNENDFRETLKEFLSSNNDVTYPSDGWPWPWNDSNLTDYAYIFETNKVLASCFGGNLFDPLLENEENEDNKGEHPVFPDMKELKNVAFGKRSGLIIVHQTPDGNINIQ